MQWPFRGTKLKMYTVWCRMAPSYDMHAFFYCVSANIVNACISLLITLFIPYTTHSLPYCFVVTKLAYKIYSHRTQTIDTELCQWPNGYEAHCNEVIFLMFDIVGLEACLKSV